MEKKYTIIIGEEFNTTEEMADALREIAKKVEEGYTSGHAPNFQVIADINE